MSLGHICLEPSLGWGKKRLRFPSHPGTLSCQEKERLVIEWPSWNWQPGHRPQGSGETQGSGGKELDTVLLLPLEVQSKNCEVCNSRNLCFAHRRVPSALEHNTCSTNSGRMRKAFSAMLCLFGEKLRQDPGFCGIGMPCGGRSSCDIHSGRVCARHGV